MQDGSKNMKPSKDYAVKVFQSVKSVEGCEWTVISFVTSRTVTNTRQLNRHSEKSVRWSNIRIIFAKDGTKDAAMPNRFIKSF